MLYDLLDKAPSLAALIYEDAMSAIRIILKAIKLIKSGSLSIEFRNETKWRKLFKSDISGNYLAYDCIGSEKSKENRSLSKALRFLIEGK